MALASGVALALASGCGSAESQTSANDPQIEATFDRIQNHWTKVGLGDMGRIANTNLVTLQADGDTFLCHNDSDTTKSDPTRIRPRSATFVARYCVAENTVVILHDKLEAELNRATKDASAGAYKLFITAHELGHTVAEARNVGSVLPEVNEQYADCYAGSAVAAVAANEIPNIVDYWQEHTMGLVNHGSGSEISAAFTAGTKDLTGSVCDGYVPKV